ncbi:FHA domain-containing protein [Streptomyces sp. H10-C2]|uniref:FHA domain-containing protein n=1 Tax=unclassified Streptomyces TaxID=2593676 RepID=UPI0024BBADBF|nr:MULTISPECIES: FHA domain-containing protein [unclassified Streptomyces]MDJ0340078.1 FHA domain-containing protein [Streptomyces sp. PH10-H1]MDJ0369285.1 FHA domain-containing protein [Streptomyces sp. H10-C2]
MSTCPNGHQSGTDDWCEVCGHRMSAPAVSSPSAGSGPAPMAAGYDPDATAAAEPCPSCGTLREGSALFCEECRYNFQTHTPTTFVSPSPAASPLSPGFPPYQRYESQRSRPSQMNRAAEPLAPDAVTSGGSGDFLLTPPSVPSTPAGAPRAEAGATPEAGASAAPAAPEVAVWTAVIAADRDYFTAMMARSGPDATGLYFPSYSPELRLPMTGNQITIGRRRHSTGEAPDIDLSRAPEDPGVSHKHAVLVQQPDGGWSVVDQDSTNGTTVNGAADPIQPYLPVPLKDGDRVHVGAWTTITVKRD